MRGRKPKPTEMKRRAGNPGKRKLPQAEPKPRVSPDMKVGAIGRLATQFRERYLPELRRLKVLTDVDVAAFELMGPHYAMAWTAARRQGWAMKARAKTRKSKRPQADGFYFDERAATIAVRFFEQLLHHSKGEWAGDPFILEKWQREQIIKPLFGWKRAGGSRGDRSAGGGYEPHK